ncbi:MAG: hypothetical protein KGR69_06435 [Verrucomicrobia bacterium]|nr:hypothetical protein [Verrucomicrobiota bacterium]
MSAKPFKFRYVNRITGAFLFVAGAVLAVLLVLVAKSQHWFERKTLYRVEMPVGFRGDENPGGTLGIRAGSEVRVIGNQVGHVDRVDLCAGEDLVPIESFDSVDPNDIRIVAVLAVKGGFSHFIGPDSVAVLKFDLGGLGSAYFDVSRGTKRFDPAFDEPGVPRRLVFGRERDAKEEVFEIVSRLEGEIIPAVRRIEETATAAKSFFEKLNDENEALYRSLTSLEKGINDMNRVMAQAASGDGALGDMIQSDTRMRREFNEFATTLNRGTQSLERAVNSLGEGIDELRAKGFTSFNDAAEEFPGTLDNTNAAINQIEAGARQFQETVREFEVLVEGLQKHWLVRKNIEDPLEDPPDNPKPKTSPSKPEPNREREKEGLFKKLFNKNAE